MSERTDSGSFSRVLRPESSLVLPGDTVLADARAQLPANLVPLRVGPGITALPDWNRPSQLIATRTGRLRYAPRMHVESNQRRYIPYVNDVVVGVVVDRVGGDHYRVAIGAATPALLPLLAFEGATKRNRPHLAPGHVVYARVTQVPTPQRFAETELSCQAPGSAKSWTSGEAIFGRLAGGTLFRISLAAARQMIRQDAPVLQQLGKQLVFELAIGMNGIVWVKGRTTRTTILVRHAIQHGIRSSPTEARRLVRQLLEAVAQADTESMQTL
jgi:exosome complex component RRP40